MRFWYSIVMGARRIAPIITIFIIVNFLVLSPVLASGGLAISGSFYRQEFEIPQGSSISSPEVYVVVFNNSEAELAIKMTTQTPVGVKINFSHNDFPLTSGSQQKVIVGIEVTQDAVPGDYNISVNAESYRKGSTGIQIMGAAGQTASLKVLGESASVSVQAVSPEGQPLVAVVRLYKLISNQSYEVAFSETGNLNTKVAPGNFIAAVYIGGQKVTEENFLIIAGENKTLNLSASTVYFEGFGIVPNYQKETGELAFAKVVYTVRNLYKPVDKAEVILDVNYNSNSLEEITLANLSPLDMGQASLNYNYIPSGGWQNGSYSFQLKLNLDGKPYTNSLEQQLNVNATTGSKGGMSPALIWGIIGGVIVLAGVVFILIRRFRRG